jgi:hypothetical protein
MRPGASPASMIRVQIKSLLNKYKIQLDDFEQRITAVPVGRGESPRQCVFFPQLAKRSKKTAF